MYFWKGALTISEGEKSYLESSEKQSRDETDIDAVFLFTLRRTYQISNGEIILLQRESLTDTHCYRLRLVDLMQRSQSNHGMAHGGLVMGRLQHEPLPELRPKEPGELWARPLHEEGE